MFLEIEHPSVKEIYHRDDEGSRHVIINDKNPSNNSDNDKKQDDEKKK